ncbi:hypothetical protein ECDEC5C_5236 [Escherichia coli DEC5C]|nr:hypothetical protein ECDEC5C_5236 [Escherichia coli DEC5C]
MIYHFNAVEKFLTQYLRKIISYKNYISFHIVNTPKTTVYKPSKKW